MRTRFFAQSALVAAATLVTGGLHAQVPATTGAEEIKPTMAAPPGAAPAPPKPVGPTDEEAPPAPRRATAKTPTLAPRLEWRWPKFELYQLGLTIGQGAIAAGASAIPSFQNWKDPNAFDDAARDALRFRKRDDSRIARDASDVGLVLLLNQQLVDTLFVTWWYHDKGSTALQMALIDLQTITFSAGLNSFITGFMGRERPYGRAICYEGLEAETSDCLGDNRYHSFFSGHATAAFTLAALTCVHHINLPLYGGGAVEAIPCAAGMVLASGVALMRVAADQHYLSDVMTGAAFGTASGFAIPYLFHYGHTTAEESPTLKAAGVDSMTILPTAGGVQMTGMF